MAKTVGFPVAMAAELIMEGFFNLTKGNLNARGVIAPIKEDIYNPILMKLENAGINFVEKSSKLETQKIRK